MTINTSNYAGGVPAVQVNYADRTPPVERSRCDGNPPVQLSEAELQQFFAKAAGDDGILTKDEFKAFLKALNPALTDAEIQARVDALFKKDIANDGLTYDEFAKN